jgi:hypothetical protein
MVCWNILRRGFAAFVVVVEFQVQPMGVAAAAEKALLAGVGIRDFRFHDGPIFL